MNRYEREIYQISGDGGEVMLGDKIIAEVKEWNVSIYQGFIEERSFGNESTAVLGLLSWKGKACIKLNKSIELPKVLLEISCSTVQLKLSDSRENTSYNEVEAKLDFRVGFTNGIPDKLNVKIKGTGEFPLDPSLFKPL